MRKIGITGNIGSGKTWVCKIFEALDIPIFYADLEARIILNSPSVITELADTFGSQIVSSTEKIDRKALASIVFNNSSELNKLNRIIHPKLRLMFLNWAQKQEALYVIQEAAILFENGFDAIMDKTITVAAPKNIRLGRVIKRDGASQEEVLARMKHQWSDIKKENAADYIIQNDGHQMVLPQVIHIHQQITQQTDL